MYVGLCFFKSIESLKVFKNILLLFVVIWIALSVIETLYMPLLEIPIIQSLIFPGVSQEVLASIQNLQHRNMITLAMYNPNYYGGMCLLIFPFILEFYLEEKTRSKWGYLFMSSILIVCIIQCRATTTFYCMLIQLIVSIVLHIKNKILIVHKMMLLGLGVLLSVCIVTILTEGYFLNTMKKSVINENQEIKSVNVFELEEMRMNGGEIYFQDVEGHELILNTKTDQVVTAEKINCVTNYNKKLDTRIDRGKITFTDEKFNMITIKVMNPVVVIDFGYKQPMKLYLTMDGFKGVGPNGSVLELKDSVYEQNIFDHFATGRGYAWKYSMSTLKDCILWGHGPGNFAYYFPQFDYVGLLNVHGSTNFVVDKPHNMYIQTAERTGVISLVCVLLLFGKCIMGNIKVELQQHESVFSTYRRGGFLAIIGWLIYSIFNDSMVTVSPLFWFVFGINISLIMIEKKRSI